MVGFLTDLEQLRVRPNQIARMVIDEQSGVIVMGENVRIARVAIAQANLAIRITETQQVCQPDPLANADTTGKVERTRIEIDEQSDKKLVVLNSGVSLQELVNGLILLGIGPRSAAARNIAFDTEWQFLPRRWRRQ